MRVHVDHQWPLPFFARLCTFSTFFLRLRDFAAAPVEAAGGSTGAVISSNMTWSPLPDARGGIFKALHGGDH